MQESDDESLLRAANAGDSVAFSELVRRFDNKLYRIARTMLSDEQLAADAVQETFLRAFRGITRFRFGASVYTWLYAIVRNVCREQNRQNTRPVHHRHSEMDMFGTENLVDIDNNPEALLGTERQLHRVMKKIKALPERQREVFVLRVLEGLSVEETARLLKCRPGTVKAHLHRAKKIIQARPSE